MKLSDVIAATYFTTHERARGSLGGARMIYDVRQTTTYHYASPVAYARHVLRLTPIDRPGQRVHATALEVEPAPIARREGQDFFGNRMTWIELDQPHDMLSVRVAARVTVEQNGAPSRRYDPAVGRGPRRRLRLASISRGIRPRISCSRAGRSRSIRKSATMRPRALRRGGRCSTPRSI